jgi:hypothetical protein
MLSLLNRAHDDLVSEFDQQVQRILNAAQQASDGAGANDLKRLQRQFQAVKASYINIDMKRRFMEGEVGAGDVQQQKAWCLVCVDERCLACRPGLGGSGCRPPRCGVQAAGGGAGGARAAAAGPEGPD